ncbi:MAG: acetylornithine deacetylase [Gammaproteobacteria bacterium]|nr:MAG: acetylornithine deacetylase [Pseudomonadota bacterium]PIE38404.1 MAG: acetylornithine deacetylase [Gammaproteobacteria bacterium]
MTISRLPDFKSMLSELIATPSISCSCPSWDQSNRPVIDLLAGWFAELGFSCEIQTVDEARGKYNLLATRGKGTGGLVLSGHSDTVPYDQGAWNHDPFTLTEKDNRFFGLGTCDMKGYFAVVAEAIRSLGDIEFKHPVVVLATADEESSMSGARQIAESGKSLGRCAVIGEPTSLIPVRMHKGILMEVIRIRGQSGHSSNPALGRSALDCMHAVLGELVAWRQWLQQHYHHPGFEVSVPTLNLGHIHGGDNPNRICGFCELQYDLRPLPGMDINQLREDISRRVKPVAQRFETDIQVEPLFPGVAPFETPADAELVRMSEKLTGCPAESVAFATEAPFLQNTGLETIVLGPGSIDQAHQPDEFLAFDQIGRSVELIRKLIIHYCS